MEIHRPKLKADKTLVVAQNLNLTEAEGAAFWPVYEPYQNCQRLETILAYTDAYIEGPVANETAKKPLDESLNRCH